MPTGGADSVIMADMLARMETIMHVRVASLAPYLSAMPKLRLAILGMNRCPSWFSRSCPSFGFPAGSILYAYAASWKVESLPMLIGRPSTDFAEENLIGLGLAQEEGADSKVDKSDLANIRR